MERFYLGKVGISVVNLQTAVNFITNAVSSNNYGYVCVTNSLASYISNKDSSYCQIQNSSMLTVPDGMPLVWIAHNKGYQNMGKVSGQDLMDAIFKISVENNYSHYFYGCSQSTIDRLQEKLNRKYPGLVIKDAVSPPFQLAEAFDIKGIAKEVNRLEPTFFWCGLGAPKQEMVVERLQPHLKKTVAIGVGLAFEYYAGTVKRAPIWMQKSGLEWTYRLVQQPLKISPNLSPFWFVIKRVITSTPLLRSSQINIDKKEIL